MFIIVSLAGFRTYIQREKLIYQFGVVISTSPMLLPFRTTLLILGTKL